MVTHVPSSPTFSTDAFSQRAQSTSSSVPPYQRRPYPTYPPSAAHSVARLPLVQSQPPASNPRSSYVPSRDPSVSSSASTLAAPTENRRRHHHRGRHARTTSGIIASRATSENEFPWFSQSGDVEIILRDRGHSKEQRYLLHALILSQNSGYLAEELGQRHVSTHVRARGPYMPETARRYYFELDWSNSASEFPVLVQKSVQEATSRAPRPAANTSVLRTLANTISRRRRSSSSSRSHTYHDRNASTSSLSSEADTDILMAYHNLFSTFYHHTPTLSSTNLATAYVECKSLLSLAALHNALPTIRPHVNHHLLGFGPRLHAQIAKYPASYLKLGHLARSRLIFSEALIHVVGQWPAGSQQLHRSTVDSKLLDLIDDKVDELDDLKSRIDAKLFRITLTTSRGERTSPGNAWFDWLAVSLFRDWFAEHTTPPPAPILRDRDGDGHRRRRSRDREQRRRESAYDPSGTYRRIAAGEQAYLTRDELKRFLKSDHPPGREVHIRENVKRLDRGIAEVKSLASTIVRPLVRNFLEGGLGKYEWLTCTRVEERDFDFVWGSAA